MRTFLLVSLLVCFTVCVNASGLYSICKKDVFKYKDFEVNSFYKVDKKVTYDPLDSFLMNLNTSEIPDANDSEKYLLDATVEFYNQDFSQFYGYMPESFGKNWLDAWRLTFSEWMTGIDSIQKYHNNSKALKHYEQVRGIVKKVIDMIDNLMPVAQGKLTENLISKEDLSKVLASKDLRKVAPLPLGTDLDIYYTEKLVKLNKMTFSFKGNGVFHIEMMIPTTKKGSSFLCKNAKDLPEFFQKNV